ncbi:MAG: MTAP family purine nucleoside phosphorylase [Thermoplasmatales archaeon]|nr:MAG: MTAP family purine nucleoside phosphorylase [Thermoplasmatales archaeon]
MMKIGIISGYSIANFVKDPEKIMVETTFGDISVEVSRMKNHDLFFINRHGEKSDVPPHKVNYLGNVQAFASSHVECILSIGTVGSMKKSIQPGDFVVPYDFIDFTKSRKLTFFDDKRVHVDMINPYCPSLRKSLIKNCKKVHGATFHDTGIYLTTEGPRLETASEISYFSKFADIVGMTGVPEVVLAREKSICYASLCVVCNMAAGLQNKLTAGEISKIYTKREPIISNIIQLTIDSIDEKRKCNCKNDLSKATL